MARLLLVPLAITGVLAGLVPLATLAVAGWHGVWEGLNDPALVPALRQAPLAAALAAGIAVPLGLTGALAVAPSGPALRAAVYALAVLLLLAPAPGFRGLDFLFPPNPARAVAFACAVARGAALALLILTPNLHALPPGLRRAAIMAGATPWQAAFHAVLAPLAWPLAGATFAAAAAALAEGPASIVLAPHLDLARAWVAPATLLLAAGSITALSVLLRRQPA